MTLILLWKGSLNEIRDSLQCELKEPLKLKLVSSALDLTDEFIK